MTQAGTQEALAQEALAQRVRRIVDATPVVDMHTHLYAPALKELLLCGADELMCFHYLISESFRVHRLPYDVFWGMSKREQAEVVWRALFEQSTPLSEAASGVIEIAQAFGMQPGRFTLHDLRAVLSDTPTAAYIDKVFQLAGVDLVVMTNDPFDRAERAYWAQGVEIDPKFRASLRLDTLVNQFADACQDLQAQGFDVAPDLSGRTFAELERWLESWVERTQPVYVAFSAADDLVYPDDGVRGQLLDKVLLPVCRRHKLPLSLMIGARRRVNPDLRLAGDSVTQASLRPVERLCADNPDNKFLITMLARENQHELVVTARKFHNLMPFGCWWFVNTDTLVEEITRLRLELLGPTFIPQHSDARVLEHLIYKWQRARDVVARVLTDKYGALVRRGWAVEDADIERDVRRLFRDNFWDFVQA
ncbi:glucuronate isomerase [Alicyclobacillus cellulosilyticus]|uniref:Glucuronate isomerase n=1 Tax=Alicyclobacillus cellulosilyticus TaxID=1003997 RepID=A0A917NFY6_9BACL|nr:glucuronate isomerase [Alicyclobacillus cellulosilyticus]GGI98388.1 glucuronate isomerase [Alicyclobacillus cellulosilyticus]